MNFKEAMELMKEGKKVGRSKWKKEFFFSLNGPLIKSYRESMSEFVYSEDIMISEGWVISEDNNHTEKFNYMKEYCFYEIMPFLLEGFLAKPKEWTEDFIFFQPNDKMLVRKSMEQYAFVPLFGDFISEDWMVIE